MLQGSGASAQGGARKVAVGKTLFIAAVGAIIPLIGNVVASFLTTWTGIGSWLVVPVVGVVVAMITALIQAYGSAPEDEHPRPPARGYPPYPVPPSRRTPLWRALLIAFLVIGVGGAAELLEYLRPRRRLHHRALHQAHARLDELRSSAVAG